MKSHNGCNIGTNLFKDAEFNSTSFCIKACANFADPIGGVRSAEVVWGGNSEASCGGSGLPLIGVFASAGNIPAALNEAIRELGPSAGEVVWATDGGGCVGRDIIGGVCEGWGVGFVADARRLASVLDDRSALRSVVCGVCDGDCAICDGSGGGCVCDGYGCGLCTAGEIGTGGAE